MKFIKRDDILLAWGNDEIQYYVPLVQSLGVNIGTNVATVAQSGTYEKRQEILTSPTIEIPIEILGKDNVINEEFYFFNSPSEIEKPIFNDINSPINIFVLLNDKNEHDDLIKIVESASYGESHDVYGLEINNCYLDSYSLSIQAGDLIIHSLSFSGNNAEGKRIPIVDARNNKDLVKKNIGLASNFNLYASDRLFNQPVSSFSISLNIDRKTKYVFAKKSDISDNTNNGLSPKINKAESSCNCILNINTVCDLKSKDFTTEYLRNAESLLKDFRIIHDEPSINDAPIRTSINFYNATLNDIEIEENVDGFMNISYSFNVVVPTEAVNDIRKGITTRKRYEKYILATNRRDMLNIDANYRTDLRNGVWDWELDNLEDGSDLFNFQNVQGENLLTAFNTHCLPRLNNGSRMFQETANLEGLDLILPECTGMRGFASYSKAIKKAVLDIPKCTILNEAFRNIPTLKELTIKRHNSTSAATMCYQDSQLDKIDMDFSNITSLSYFAEGAGFLDFKHNLSKVENGNNAFMSCKKMYEFNSALPSLGVGDRMFRWSELLSTFRYPIDEDGNSIYESGKSQALNSDGTGLFAYLTLPKAYHLTECFSAMRVDLLSALSILKSLRQKVDIENPIINPPSWTITLSMENTYQNNVELASAIEQAKTRGWTILMQWQTPRARNLGSSRKNTLPFLNQENLFLLKKIEDKNGIFEDEFGKRFEIIGGNEIYSEEGQFDYERFSSYEEAIDKWRLVYKRSMLPEGDKFKEPEEMG